MKFSTTFSILLAAVAIHAVPVPLNDDVAGIALGLWHTDDADALELGKRETALNDDEAGLVLGLWRTDQKRSLNDDAAGLELGLWRSDDA